MKNILTKINPFNTKEDMPAGYYIIKKLLAFILIYIASSLIAEAVVIGIHYILGYKVLEGEMLSAQTMTLLKYYGFVIFMIVAMLYCKVIEKRPLTSLGFNRKLFGYVKGILVGIVLIAFCIGLITLFGGITYEGIFDSIDYPIILAFLGAFIIQGAMEETLCRGFLMTSLAKKIAMPFAIFISSLVFSVPHLSSLFTGQISFAVIGVINMLLVSVIFSLVMIGDQNIWIACGLHSCWNFCLYNIFGLNLSGADQSATAIFRFSTNKDTIINGGPFGIEASIVTTGVYLCCVIILYMRYRKISVE